MSNLFHQKNVIVLGLAKSGLSTALFLLKSGANVTVSALKKDILDSDLKLLEDLGAYITFGEHPLDLLTHNIDFIVKNPGIPYSIPFLMEAKLKNIPVYSELEITHTFLKDTIAITGSNGKTTTTMLLQKVINLEKDCITCGNIGRPLSDVILQNDNNKTLVMELSSFQLKGTESFKPNIAILLNINESHLDYHKTLNDYVSSKAMITNNQLSTDTFIYNFDDVIIKEIALQTKANTIPFSTETYCENGASIKDGFIYYMGEKFMNIQEVALPGKHNLQNILATLIVAKLHNISDNHIKKVFKTFSGVEHRLQFVTELNGRKFYNDSKATNIPAAHNAVSSFSTSPILIAGGLDRGNSFEEFVPTLKRCKTVFVYGQTSDKIIETAQTHNLSYVRKVGSLSEAVTEAYQSSTMEDIILLSPACASWDQFKSFEERGEHFIQCVRNL
ncbi:UDP-N-acetylmuramoyl-L-alanine--D-glutamate ligase [Priestia filamentosa]|uniref:UDP-N-acetylmuramoyl-L-alanine--D-glutamate ligase n=1 Tax=Priestia filamentosa TaxID=1402861 RepID=UPI000588F900